MKKHPDRSSGNCPTERSLLSDSKGATMVEYALLITFLALVVVATIKLLGQQSSESLSSLGYQMNRSPSLPGSPGYSN